LRQWVTTNYSENEDYDASGNGRVNGIGKSVWPNQECEHEHKRWYTAIYQTAPPTNCSVKDQAFGRDIGNSFVLGQVRSLWGLLLLLAHRIYLIS
jgi:hypothetical protein